MQLNGRCCCKETQPMTEQNLEFSYPHIWKSAKLFTRHLCLAYVIKHKLYELHTFITRARCAHAIESSFTNVYCKIEFACKQLCWFTGCNAGKILRLCSFGDGVSLQQHLLFRLSQGVWNSQKFDLLFTQDFGICTSIIRVKRQNIFFI